MERQAAVWAAAGRVAAGAEVDGSETVAVAREVATRVAAKAVAVAVAREATVAAAARRADQKS